MVIVTEIQSKALITELQNFSPHSEYSTAKPPGTHHNFKSEYVPKGHFCSCNRKSQSFIILKPQIIKNKVGKSSVRAEINKVTVTKDMCNLS